jgi:iron complex outermembrane recepter protein
MVMIGDLPRSLAMSIATMPRRAAAMKRSARSVFRKLVFGSLGLTGVAYTSLLFGDAPVSELPPADPVPVQASAGKTLPVAGQAQLAQPTQAELPPADAVPVQADAAKMLPAAGQAQPAQSAQGEMPLADGVFIEPGVAKTSPPGAQVPPPRPALPELPPADPVPVQASADKTLPVAAQTQPAQPAQPAQPVQPPQLTPPTPEAAPPREVGAISLESLLPSVLGPAAAPAAPPQAQSTGSGAGTSKQDTGSFLASSAAATGVEVQQRSQVSYDPRIRGYHVGQLTTIADGAFWTPARIDLDSAVAKINPDDIYNVIVIKGPYSVRYGPGFAFLDIETIPTFRSKSGEFEAHGSTSVGYRTNGEGWTVRDYIWGGGCNWGFRIGYDLLAGNDYREGNGDRIPSSYNSQNVDVALGFDLSSQSHLEVKYLRNMLRDTEYPGLLTDINQLNTDGANFRYVLEKTCWFDRLTVDGWYNITSFDGDALRPGKRRQIPELGNGQPPDAANPHGFGILNDPDGPDNRAFFAAGGQQVRLDLTTQGQLFTWGFREATSWGDDKGVQVTAGADINVIHQAYNEFDAFNFSVSPPFFGPNNFGIPVTQSVDPGVFLDLRLPIGDCWVVRAGTRVDFANSEFLRFGPNTDVAAYLDTTGKGTDPFSTKDYFLWSAFLTAEYNLSEQLTLSGGYGYAMRPPSLTELYTGGAFFGLIQNGFNAIYGNPALDPERLHQFDVGVKANYERFRGGAHAFFSWVQDYITYQPHPFGREFFTINDVEFNEGTFNLQTRLREFRFKNTGLATLLGGEALGEYDVRPWLTPFATLSYVQGYDETIHEPLPSITPLEARVGVRIHDPSKAPRWGLEFLARLVDEQSLVAASLGEQLTGGFTVFNVRGYWQVRDNVLLTAGVDNLGDRYYREHLDLRTGLGVFQPGINFYFGMRVNY